MSDTTLEILLVEDNPGDALLVQEMLLDADEEGFVLHRAETLLDALDKLAQYEVDAILLDLNLPDSQGLETFTSMKLHAPGVPIVLLTGNDSDTLALSAVEAGAQDFLVKDRLDGDSLVRALRYAVVRQQNRSPAAEDTGAARRGKVLGVLGGKGGVGATTIACHLADALVRDHKRRVLLADLDLDSGAVGFLMQTKCPYSIVDAAENVHRMDEEFWRSMIAASPDGVEVMASPALLGQTEPPVPSRFRHVLRFAAKHYDFVVADLGRLERLTRVLLPELDSLYLITSADLMAVYGAGQVLDSLRDAGVSTDEIELIHNQASRWSSERNVLKALVSLPVRAALPACDADLAGAYTKGRLLDTDSAFGREIGRLAAAVVGEPEPDEAGNSRFSLRKLSLFGGRQVAATNQ